ncbi:Pr6Pr family membrane protein [Salinibacterium sp. NG22]|uniref:Pr6Pr family membrane protein n=1 Tax=Salinibacterium sp. NG22 TaxID=2792040 RepID=UPI0018CEBF86|nr:Pr6Pr family membrane protein [Salinibacterium sp. NG22]MBH0109377.1 Pr6Pr family membrane protein [Salinibacterium sp. NG22]
MTTNVQRKFPRSRDFAFVGGPPKVLRLVGALRLIAAALVLASIATQVIDESIHNDFVAVEYFSYFTIQSSLINVVILALSGLVAVRRQSESNLLGVLRASVVSYAVVTAVVYNVLLRGLPDEGYVGIQWPNEVIHVWVPLFLLLDWLFSPSRPVLRMRDVRIVVIYPIAWLAFTIVRGLLDGWFPYPFLEPNGPDGWGGVLVYVLGIAAFIIAIAVGLIAISRARWAHWAISDRVTASNR